MRSPVDCAQAQLDAYNNRDIHGFMAVYHDDIQLLDLRTGEPFCQGLEAMTQRYLTLFANCPDLHCDLVSRIVCGNIVIDEELVTGIHADKKVHATAIYDVHDGTIRRAWFVREES
ncbi:MAG: nuclear transport factor 2 family protein [Candidatus Kapabacteria bacterium]|jgi:hypothetical protein|nr:nuclear transport factor 2 family protein [Candidatus Kapabacteria bacterium]